MSSSTIHTTAPGRLQAIAGRLSATILQHEDIQARKRGIAGTVTKIGEQAANLF